VQRLQSGRLERGVFGREGTQDKREELQKSELQAE
jgi:hypothetical protein